MTTVSHAQAITLLLSGYTITEVAEMLKVSRTTIYNRRKEFLDYAKKEGTNLATKNYEVEETFEELVILARELKHNGLKVEDARRGSEIAVLLDSINIIDTKEFLTEVIQSAQSRGITGEEITRYTDELKSIENRDDKSYVQLIEDVKFRKNEYEELNIAYEIIVEKISSIRKELESNLDEARITKEHLENFVSTRDNLANNGIGLEDTKRLENIIRNLKEHEFNVEEIVEFYGVIKNSKDRLTRNNQENERLEEKNNNLRKENDALENNLEKNLVMTSAVRRQMETGITPEHILEIVRTIIEMSKVLNITRDEAINKFIMDVKTQYNERSGYIFRLDELKTIQEAYQEKNLMLKEKIEVLEEVVDDRKEAIDSLKRMEILEIENEEIVEWVRLMKYLEYDIAAFRNMVSKLGGLPEYIKEKTKHISYLEAKEEELQKNVDELEKRIIAIKETLSLVHETVVSESGKIKEAVETFEEYFTSPEVGFRARSTRIVDDIVMNLTDLLSQTKKNWDKDLEVLDGTVKKVVEETDRILNNAYTGGRIIGRFHALEPIYKILREETVPITEATIGIITMLTYIKIWLRKNYNDNLAESFDKVIEKLTSDLGDIYQR